jgi:hypothetical protein
VLSHVDERGFGSDRAREFSRCNVIVHACKLATSVCVMTISHSLPHTIVVY